MKQKHTWTTIAEERNNAHNKIEHILHASKTTSSFLNEYGKAVGAAAFGLALLAGSFFLPGTDLYKAALEIPQVPGVTTDSSSTESGAEEFLLADTAIDFEDEAQEIDIEPLLSVDEPVESFEPFLSHEESGSTPLFDLPTDPQETIDDIIATDIDLEKDSDFASVEQEEGVSESAKTSTITLNPFESIEESSVFVEEGKSGTIESNDFPVAPVATSSAQSFDSEEFLHSAAPAAGAFSPFKENTHTYDTVSEPVVSAGNLEDPLLNVYTSSIENEELHGVARIVSVTEKEELPKEENDSVSSSYKYSDEYLYTGILRSRHRPDNFSHPFAFFLELDDGARMKLNTSRDLRSVIGKELTIEIDGTIDDFVLQHVYYKPQSQSPQALAQSGPEALMIVIGLIAFGGSFFRRYVL
ncbi:hypothetical protein HON22_05120 [Candidatus Peregrinibacteria bacterium]|jgi:hypothetical protein|nr:hypothetical protein [Candidatus Peregrinibacteria bacterium]